uniref:MFS domain-containing protein n=1 Tax=Heterorhabditis bacteriophora TaxID=37862 RepID=A0A1I7WPW0_HETBA
MVDDIAFEHFEKNESVLDAVWNTVNNSELMKELLIIIFVKACSSHVAYYLKRDITEMNLGGFEIQVMNAAVMYGGFVIALFMNSHRRLLAIKIGLLVIAVSLLGVVLTNPDRLDGCTHRYVRSGILSKNNEICGINNIIHYYL